MAARGEYGLPTSASSGAVAEPLGADMRDHVPIRAKNADFVRCSENINAVTDIQISHVDDIAARKRCQSTLRIRCPLGCLGIKLVGVEMDGDGILPEALKKEIERHKPRMLYLNPTLQNPTTITIPTKNRVEIAQIISDYRVPLIEDDAFGFIPEKSPAPIAASAPELTWYIGGLAQCIGAGLRLAYTVAPSAKHMLALAESIKAITVMPSPLPMALATRWIEDGTADLIRRSIRRETAARQQIAAKAFEGLDFLSAANAFNIWLRLPGGASRADVIAQMAGRHVGIIPSDAFTVSGEVDEHVRLCLGGSIGRAELETSLHYMAHLLMPNAYLD